MDGMRKLTLLDDAVRAFRYGRAVAGGGTGKRRLFGVGEGPAEAVAKQESEDWCLSGVYESGQVVQKWVSRHLVATCQ